MHHFLKNDDGATAIEYGLILALIVLVLLAGLTALGNGSTNSFGGTANKVSEAM